VRQSSAAFDWRREFQKRQRAGAVQNLSANPRLKMDAMQKRRMWKVAIGHFCLTLFMLFILWKLLHTDWSGSFQKEVWVNAVGLVSLKFFILLQPLLSFFVWVFKFISVPDGNLGGLVEFLEGLAIFFAVPLWSICFGWIYVKFTNWLNHISVLGKKVF
jgi:hypothetical protein